MEVPNMKEKKHNSNQQSPQTPELVLPIEQDSVQILTAAEDVRKQMQEYFPRMLEEDLESDAALRAESLKRASSNLSKASKTIYAVKDELAGRMKDIRQQRKKNMLLSAPANATIDQQEQEGDHFAKGLNGYKLLLVCFIGSFFGVIIEMLWCLVSRGYIESRAGLVYGPFNLLYGFGAVVLTVTLYKFRNRGAWISFLGGIIVGSVVEYVCSWGQELVFGTRSWDYSKMPFNINGRICLLYSIFWGILGVLWIKNLYPRMAKLILKIPNRVGKICTWVLLAFFVVNTVMSGIALTRWSQRNAGIPAANTFWQTIDERFPDERMEKVYANMVFSED